MLRATWILTLVTFSVCIMACGGAKKPTTASNGKSNAEVQAKRKALVEEAITKGLYTKAYKNEGALPKVVVTAKFKRLSFEDKQALISTAAAWLYDLPENGKLAKDQIVVLLDSTTNNQVGTFDDAGLHLD